MDRKEKLAEAIMLGLEEMEEAPDYLLISAQSSAKLLWDEPEIYGIPVIISYFSVEGYSGEEYQVLPCFKEARGRDIPMLVHWFHKGMSDY
jgi:hypothetical protein